MMIFKWINNISLTISILGMVVIVWGVFLTFTRLLQYEIIQFRSEKTFREREALRQRLGSYLLLGLEILIGADIINTITDPSLKEISILASIVVIRTVISYFLDLEIEN